MLFILSEAERHRLLNKSVWASLKIYEDTNKVHSVCIYSLRNQY